MSEIGNIVAEAIDFSRNIVTTRAFTVACQALGETVKKCYGQDKLTEGLITKFVKENWWMITFIGLPKALPVSKEIIEESKKKIFKTNTQYGIEEIVSYIIFQNLTTKGLPFGMEFGGALEFTSENGKIFIPKKIISGILGTVVFHPINKDETIDETYWMSFSGFKMFISELWGREDLVKRLIRLS